MNRTKHIVLAMLVSVATGVSAQTDSLSLHALIEEALVNNNLLHITHLKEMEEASKVEEMTINRYPVVMLNSLYLYRFKVGSLSIPAGTLGGIPTAAGNILLPSETLTMDFGKRSNFMAGITIYQPITQQPKITTGIRVAETDRRIASLQHSKAELEVINGVERLTYGLLAVRAQMTEAEKRIAVARQKLHDAESAQLAGKLLDADISGLTADILAKEQDLLKYKTTEAGLLADMQQLAGVDLASVALADSPEETSAEETRSLGDYIDLALGNNVDVRLSGEQITKSQLGIKAARQSYLPDVGAIAGYSYQNSMDILSKSNPYIGVSFKWNLTDAYANRQRERQSRLKHEQAVENDTQTRKTTIALVRKAYETMQEASHLTLVTAQAVDYARQTLRIEQDRLDAGLTTPLTVMEHEAELAKAEAAHYGAKQNYKTAVADMNRLIAR